MYIQPNPSYYKTDTNILQLNLPNMQLDEYGPAANVYTTPANVINNQNTVVNSKADSGVRLFGERCSSVQALGRNQCSCKRCITGIRLITYNPHCYWSVQRSLDAVYSCSQPQISSPTLHILVGIC